MRTGAERLVHETSPKLVITFRDPQQGIHGMPATPATTRKLAKASFTVAVIQRVPEGARDALAGPRTGPYDERGFRLTCCTPKDGHRQRGQQRDDTVYDVVDELQVLQFLYEYDLTALYEVPHLATCGFLPKRDEDRAYENAIVAQADTVLGTWSVAPWCEPKTYHASRLHDRLLRIFGDLDRAARAFEQTVRGARVAGPYNPMRIAQKQQFYCASDVRTAYAIVTHPNGHRLVVTYDLQHRALIAIEPIRRDVHGTEILDGYRARVLENPNYDRMRATAFSGFLATFWPAQTA